MDGACFDPQRRNGFEPDGIKDAGRERQRRHRRQAIVEEQLDRAAVDECVDGNWLIRRRRDRRSLHARELRVEADVARDMAVERIA